ncbi:MAG: hypothetical protein V3U78_01900 [Thiotrichaceae bacterium]
MKTIDYLNMINKNYNASDYKVAQLLLINKTSVHRYRNKGGTFDDNTAIKVAELLDIDYAIILTDMQIERAKNDTTRSAWAHVLEMAKSHSTALALIAVCGVSPYSITPISNESGTYAKTPQINPYYVK